MDRGAPAPFDYGHKQRDLRSGRRRCHDYVSLVIDWALGLPEELEEALWHEIIEYEETKHMPYVTSVERIGIKKGREQGLQQGLQQGKARGEARGERKGLLEGITLGLELRWGADGLRLLPEIGPIQDVYLLRAIHEGLKRVSTPEELRQIYQRTN